MNRQKIDFWGLLSLMLITLGLFGAGVSHAFLSKSNFAYSTLDGGLNNSVTSMTLINGADFPQTGYFRAVIWGSTYATPSLDPGREIVNAVYSAGNTFTIERGLEGTAAVAHSSGDHVAHSPTAGTWAELEYYILNSMYNAADLDGGQLDSRYYTESEIDTITAFAGALVNKIGNQTIATGATNTITWESEIYDVGGWHSTVTNTTRFTVPAGINYVIVGSEVVWTSNSTNYRLCQLKKNGALFDGSFQMDKAAKYGSSMPVFSAPLSVVPGDYFILDCYQDSGTSLDILPYNRTWFSIREVK